MTFQPRGDHRRRWYSALTPNRPPKDGAGDDRAEECEQVQPAAHPRPRVGVLPVAVAEIGGGPGAGDLLALVEDGGDRLVPGSLDLGSVGLHPDLLVLMGKGSHALRLRTRRLPVMSTSL